ncbi:MAG: hypothetical protein KJ056_04625 [Acidimicrobiia bacterium]|nr:hypothetical protein [Acidimicrobiia bacterium]
MNTSHPVTLAPAQAEELAGLLDGLLHFLTIGDRAALADLEFRLGNHANLHGGPFDHADYLYGTESILDTFTTLIAAYAATFDQPDDEQDPW